MNQKRAEEIATLLNSNNNLSNPLHAGHIRETKRKYYYKKLDDKVVACAALRKRSWYQFELMHISVHPDYRRRGLALELVQRVCDRAKKLGATIIQSTCKEGNKASIELLIRLGFTIVNKFKSKYSNDNIVLLQKVC